MLQRRGSRFFNSNGTLTEVSSGQCVDISAKVGPHVSLGACNGGLNQKFEVATGGVWKDTGTGGIFPPRCMQRRKGNPQHDSPSDIYFQIWAKPQPDGAMAVLAINNQAGPNFHARINFSAIEGMDPTKGYDVRDVYQRAALPTGAMGGSFVTTAFAEHDSRLLLFTPVKTDAEAVAVHQYG